MLALCEVTREYETSSGKVVALDGISLTIPGGAAVAVSGASGSGKTTLLNLLGGLDRPSRGTVCVGEHELHRLSESRLTALRASTIGFVFQQPYLLPGLTALENVVAARVGLGAPKQNMVEARHWLVQVGLEPRLDFPPRALSGGEQQRVALARALMGARPVLLADEPTGNLDPDNRDRLVELILDLRREHGLTVVVVTHDTAVAASMDTVVHLEAGRLGPANEAG